MQPNDNRPYWQFQPGNRAGVGHGRPKGKKNSLRAQLMRELRQSMWESEDGRLVTGQQALAETTLREAINGNDKFASLIYKTLCQSNKSLTINNNVLQPSQIREALDKIMLAPQLESRINSNGSMNGNGHSGNGNGHASNGH